MPVTARSPLVGALLAAGALLVVLALCRWAFSTTHRDRRALERRRRAALGGDYGLLRAVGSADGRGEAAALRERLVEAGLRATVAPDRLGGFVVLVFADDVGRARDVLAGG